MKEGYAVLWGEHGVKNFRGVKRAREFARRKANKLGEEVEIDKIRIGEIDWSQSHHAVIKPKKRVRGGAY